jgi:PAS domain-containing protein
MLVNIIVFLLGGAVGGLACWFVQRRALARRGELVPLTEAQAREAELQAGMDVLHGELAQSIREQRQHLAQRELLLDTVVQNTPAALVLTDAEAHVVYANIAARQLLGGGRSLEDRKSVV